MEKGIDKIVHLRRLIAAGSYRIPASAIADKLMAAMLEREAIAAKAVIAPSKTVSGHDHRASVFPSELGGSTCRDVSGTAPGSETDTD